MRERIFEPLAMLDTGFIVPAEQLNRLTTADSSDPETGEITVLDEPSKSWWSAPQSFPDASGWLVSTIDDYWSFVSMLLAGGSQRGQRVLPRIGLPHDDGPALAGPKHGVRYLPRREPGLGPGDGGPATGSNASLPCGFGWDGGTGTTWRSNPRSGVTGILFTQRAANSPAPPAVVEHFWAAVNAAANG